MLLLFGCGKWDVLNPTDSVLSVSTNVGIEFTFYYESEKYPGAQEIEVLNRNFGSVHVKISRRIDCWGNTTEIFNEYIAGRSTRSEKAYFSSGDRLEVYIKINNSHDDDIERWDYWQLGKATVDTIVVIDL